LKTEKEKSRQLLCKDKKKESWSKEDSEKRGLTKVWDNRISCRGNRRGPFTWGRLQRGRVALQNMEGRKLESGSFLKRDEQLSVEGPKIRMSH